MDSEISDACATHIQSRHNCKGETHVTATYIRFIASLITQTFSIVFILLLAKQVSSIFATPFFLQVESCRVHNISYLNVNSR
jgi:hypothetical protein